ncbi:DUF5018 domain-containing protein [Dawidia soli]|uniref:DUF5018 domain-containing protein n=1 Tax=Dawidia soli TaxID=2782352 RepID=A0AAP2D8V0_9BACT|nr:DUF5018 domain-containing protein [Dawidia soli]MBT1687092.1 hypothetical protein [Dawidia soli]
MYLHRTLLYLAIPAVVAVISIRCSDDDTPPKDPEQESSEKNITSFKFPGLTPVVTAAINADEKTIAATVPAGTDVTALVPTIEVSKDASVSPASGIAQDFTAPVTYTVTAEDDSKQTYTVNITVEQEIMCYPSELPEVFYYRTMYLTYNTDNTVASITYTEEGVDLHSRTEFEYTNGKHSRIDYFHDDVLVRYITITYNTDAIIVTRYPQNNGFEADQYYIYYLDGDRVTSYGRHSLKDGDSRTDSAVFTYTNDNITQVDGYSTGEEVVWSETMEYDDKPNPYAQVGFTGWDYEYMNPYSLSKNNVTVFIYNDWEFENVTETAAYTYNEEGLPLTRSFDGAAATTFAYDCR